MKKIYLLAGVLAGTFVSQAQFMNQMPETQARRTDGITRPILKQTPNDAPTAKAAGTVLWTNDFSVPADWTQTTGANHTGGDWTIQGAFPVGGPTDFSALAASGGPYDFTSVWMSPTMANGFALFNSDAAGSFVNEAYFTSPTITLSSDIVTAGGTNMDAISVSWYETYRHFQENNYLEVSNDGGVNWDQYQVNQPGEVNVNSNTPGTDPDMEIEFLTIPAPATGWTDNVQIRFFYEGAFDWFWAVDDVSISTLPDFDLKVNTSEWSFAGVEYHFIPLAQIQAASFSANVLNNGSAALTSVTLDVDVNAGAATASSTPVASLAAGATDSIGTTYTPGTAGTYDFVTTLNQTEVDDVAANNAYPPIATITVGGDIYAADDGSDDGVGGGDATIAGANVSGFEAGNYYDIVTAADVYSITVGVDTYAANEGQEIYGVLYQLNAGNFDFVAQTNFNVITAADLGADKLMWFDNAISLAAGETYFLAVGCTGDFRYTAGGISIEQTALIFYGTMSNPVTDGNFFTNATPKVRLGFTAPSVGINENAAISGLSVYPNPAVDNATVKFELANATDVTFSVTDLSGKVIFTNNLGNVAAGTHTLNIPTANMANGVYFYNFTAGETVVSEKLVVKK